MIFRYLDIYLDIPGQGQRRPLAVLALALVPQPRHEPRPLGLVPPHLREGLDVVKLRVEVTRQTAGSRGRGAVAGRLLVQLLVCGVAALTQYLTIDSSFIAQQLDKVHVEHCKTNKSFIISTAHFESPDVHCC